MIAAKSRDQLETAARALDRVLRAGHYWVPHWYKASNNIAYWDKFSRPETKARFDRGILDTWWYDGAKAAKLTPVAAKTPDTEGGSEPGHSSPRRTDFRNSARARPRRLRADQVPAAASGRTPDGPWLRHFSPRGRVVSPAESCETPYESQQKGSRSVPA